MDSHLRQSTQRVVRIGPAVAVGDGFTPVTSLALAGAEDEAELLKNTGGIVDIAGRTFAAITTADGYYDLTLTTADTDTVGPLTVLIHDDSLILPLSHRYEVIEESIYDALYAASAAGFDGNQRVDVGSWLGTAAATPNNAGVPLIDLVRIVGGLVPAPSTTGVPDVNVERWLDTLVTLSASTPDVNIQSTDDIALSTTQKAEAAYRAS